MGLVHVPRVLFLDEPSTGLDPQNRANLQELIRRLHAESGSTVVLTTHYLEEADALAGRVIVVDHGRIIADDSAARLKSGPRRPRPARVRRPRPRSAARPPGSSGCPTSRVDVDGDAVSLRVRDGSRDRRRAARRPGRGRRTPGPGRGRPTHPRRRLPRPHRPQPARDASRTDRRRQTPSHRDCHDPPRPTSEVAA